MAARTPRRPPPSPPPSPPPPPPLRVLRLAEGTLLYHGTQYAGVRTLDRPGWLAESKDVAWRWAYSREWDETDDLDPPKPQVVTFRVARELCLVVPDARIIPSSYMHRAADAFCPQRVRLAAELGVIALDGWIVREGLCDELGVDPEVMLCETSGIEYVRTARPKA